MLRERTYLFLKSGIPIMVVMALMTWMLVDVNAQNSKFKISIAGADDTSETTLSQPTQLLQSMGMTTKEIQNQLRFRPHIIVEGAGFVRNVGLASFTNISDAQSTQFSIQVEGAGSARVVGLAAFTEVSDQLSSRSGIHVVGAGSVRNVRLIAPTP